MVYFVFNKCLLYPIVFFVCQTKLFWNVFLVSVKIFVTFVAF